MRKIWSKLILSSFIIFLLASCSLEDNKKYYLIECYSYCNGIQERVLNSGNQRIEDKSISGNIIQYLISVVDKQNRTVDPIEEYLEETFMIQSNDNNIMLLKEELLNKTDSQSKEEYVQAVQNYFHDRYWSANYSFTELFIHQGNSYSIEPRTFSALEALDMEMLDTLSASNLFIALMRANNIPSKIILGYSTKI